MINVTHIIKALQEFQRVQLVDINNVYTFTLEDNAIHLNVSPHSVPKEDSDNVRQELRNALEELSAVKRELESKEADRQSAYKEIGRLNAKLHGIATNLNEHRKHLEELKTMFDNQKIKPERIRDFLSASFDITSLIANHLDNNITPQQDKIAQGNYYPGKVIEVNDPSYSLTTQLMQMSEHVAHLKEELARDSERFNSIANLLNKINKVFEKRGQEKHFNFDAHVLSIQSLINSIESYIPIEYQPIIKHGK